MNAATEETVMALSGSTGSGWVTKAPSVSDTG